MLRITRMDGTAGATLLKLEGRLRGLWVEELARLCAELPGSVAPIHLDLAAVSFADDAGVRLLRTCLRQGARMVACSGIVAELLRGSNP